MEESKDKPARKPSRRDVRSSPKAATLPAGAFLMTHSNEGFFTKIRRCLRLKGKGKYDFSHPEPESAAANSGSQSHSTSSPTNVENGHADKSQVRSSPLKLSRRSKQDKEEVVLVRKDKRSSFGLRLAVKSAGDIGTGRDDVFVVHVDDKRAGKEKGAAVSNNAAPSPKTDFKESDNVFEDIDPDYETLDNIRQKIRSQVGAGHEANEVTTKQTKTTTGQPLQLRNKTSSDGRDSGLGSPFTDSPGSGRDSQVQSVTSSTVSGSAVFSEISDRMKESTHSATSIVLVNGEPAGDPDSRPGIAQLNSSVSALEEDDLYANSKVLFRKKSQRQSSDGSPSPLDPHLADGGGQGLSSARNSLAKADVPALMDDNIAVSLSPPPLPARNYSEEDVASLSKGAESSCSKNAKQSVSENSMLTQTTHTEIGTVSGAGARPKTTKTTSFSANNSPLPSLPTQNQPAYTNPYADVDDVELSSNSSPDNVQNSADTYLKTCENIYEDIPAGADAKVKSADNPQVETVRKPEDDLLFIDEDLSTARSGSEGKSLPPAANQDVELPDDVMIVSASDSMCGNETDESQASDKAAVADGVNSPQLATVEEVTKAGAKTLSSGYDKKTTSCNDISKDIAKTAGSSADKLPKDSEANKSNLEENDVSCGKNSSELTGASSSAIANPELCAASAAEPFTAADQAVCDNATASSSSSSSSQQLSASSPTSSPSTDTLNDMDNFDPDDLEGKDLNPPSGPPIHMSHRQVWCRADMRWLVVPPPIPPHRQASGRSSNRSAKSMDLSCALLDGDNQTASTSSARRHSGTASYAKLHQDFLESMKQLKDCGWYWGPLSYEEAESKLADKRDGSFLVRDSSNENYILSLSFKSLGQVHHTRIEHHKGLFSFWSQPDSHGKAQICQFIEQTVENSRNGRFLYFLRPAGPGAPPMPIQLLFPVSRFCRVPSLQHMCRFLVLRLVRRDHIDHLPLPQKVKAYLLEKQYYVETLEED